MSDHYYSEHPQSDFTTETWNYFINGQQFTFTSGTGVFSKGKVDFGSALLIETFREPKVEGNFLDLGCGYGPIGITLAHKYSNREIIMVDVNERAVTLAELNVKQNNLLNATVIQSDGLSKLEQQDPFAAIVMNPPIRTGKKTIYSLFEQCKSALAPSGVLWIVMQKKQGAPSAMKYLASLFQHVDVIKRKKGYFIIRAN